MRELIGECQLCGKPVYCENGFFDGEQMNGKLTCNSCAEKIESTEENGQT
ncbi:hypothetical protein GCM10011409_34170 [Lentibacillus populi]|uniref:Uncharacterized protein n=1 Tax=Lentibacillus populi TaxID=1827502 RepID=A0A9W5X753_9BACI|nr:MULTISPECIES: hypothetical protein [Bacillaceae]MBT2216249.1 hypothetical protein [Virgibacillus dakarensis]GGB53705.1 hypothetical protein GCM10011409_34170 [Lentibacillus populi]